MIAIIITWTVISIAVALAWAVGAKIGFNKGYEEGRIDHWARGYFDGQMDAAGGSNIME